MDVDLPCHDLRDHSEGVAELTDAESDILSSQASRRPTDFVRRNCIVMFFLSNYCHLRGRPSIAAQTVALLSIIYQ